MYVCVSVTFENINESQITQVARMCSTCSTHPACCKLVSHVPYEICMHTAPLDLLKIGCVPTAAVVSTGGWGYTLPPDTLPPIPYPLPRYPTPWKGPGTRDTLPPGRTWSQGYPTSPCEQNDQNTLLKTIPSRNFVGGRLKNSPQTG